MATVLGVKVGLTLPQFGADVGAVRAAVEQAEAVGVDGVFVFDHLWPIGNPDGTVLHSTPLLGFLAAVTDRLVVGSLVARVGIVPDAVLVNQFASLHRMLGPRLVAGLGTGDRLSAAENRAYGIAYPPAQERLDRLDRVAGDLAGAGIEVWVGGRSAAVRTVAATRAAALNVWAATPAQVEVEAADLRSRSGDRPVGITWGGQVLIGWDDAHAADLLDRHGPRPDLVHGSVDTVATHFAALAAAGCTWLVCAPLDITGTDTAARLVAASTRARETASGTGPVVH